MGSVVLVTGVSRYLGGRFALRACMVNPMTTEDDIDLVARLIVRTGDELLATPSDVGA